MHVLRMDPVEVPDDLKVDHCSGCSYFLQLLMLVKAPDGKCGSSKLTPYAKHD